MITFFAGVFTSCEKDEPTNTFTDIRDGKTYKFIDVGNQRWMAENLKYIPDGVIWVYDNNQSNSDIYGLLYNWEAAKKVCPNGWHLPTLTEWEELVNSLGGHEVAGGKMKETGTVHWQSPNKGATNESGFTGLPGGNYTDSIGGGSFKFIEKEAYWWSNTEGSTEISAKIMFLNYDVAKAYTLFVGLKTDGFSVRCVKD